ncbi:MAG: AraC family transcriptional regulator ligand-binding domain-containing protein [Mangrovicoccus sp.]
MESITPYLAWLRDGSTVFPALFARKQINEAIHMADPAPLYAILGLTTDTINDPTALVAPEAYYSLLETIAESEWPNPGFHMRVCAGMRCEDLGAFGLAFKSAPSLRHAFQRLSRYTRLINPVADFATVDRGDAFCWTLKNPTMPRLGCFLSNEAALGTTLSLCRETTRKPDLTPLRVQFTHERDGSIQPLIEHFGIEPIFGQERDGIQLPLDEMDQPTAIGDASIWRFFTDHMESQLAEQNPPKIPAEIPLETQLMEEIAKLLSGGVPALTEVATQLGIGARTLQRRLADRGTSFQALVDEARRHLAQQLLDSSGYSLSEIAFLTGFSEQSAFTRAFKRWEGQSPRAYRQAANRV